MAAVLLLLGFVGSTARIMTNIIILLFLFFCGLPPLYNNAWQQPILQNNNNNNQPRHRQCWQHHQLLSSSLQQRDHSPHPTHLDERRQQDDNNKAFPQQTPHSGRHFWPSHPAYDHRQNKLLLWRLWRRRRPKRFTEGWYYRLTLMEKEEEDERQEPISFAFIISIEDPGKPESDVKLACIQVIGPHDEYLVQGDRDDTRFWAWKKQQGLGCIFDYYKDDGVDDVDEDVVRRKTVLDPSEWDSTVQSGFQILPTAFLGRVRGRDGTKGTILDNSNGEAFGCDFNFTINPICGWGGSLEYQQKSTAGWLASFPIFEPHWQITLADARASGTVTWKDQTYHFTNAPFYAEKNWGAALPQKWYWTQCNSFEGYDQLSVVAGGGIRKVPFGKQEALGMVSVHYEGQLYEAVPWMGGMSWKVATWGSWELKGNSTLNERPFEVEVTYKCDPMHTPGLVFRAPTHEGLVRFCRDTFEAECTLSMWELEWDQTTKQFVRGQPLIDRAVSKQGGAEVGGGPWWDTWIGEARVKRPIKALLQLPYRLRRVKQSVFRSRKEKTLQIDN